MQHSPNQLFKRLGQVLRDQSLNVADAALPDDMRALLLRIASAEARNDLLLLHHSSIVSRSANAVPIPSGTRDFLSLMPS
jgi:hypothetical protein